MGDLFRTRAFNFHARKAAPPRSLDTLTLRELYALKTETSNRALSAKMLADIYKKLENIHVQSTCRINTPLITKCLQSPIVSKNAALAKHHQTAPQQASQLLSSKQLLCQHICLHALADELFVRLKQKFAACRCWTG